VRLRALVDRYLDLVARVLRNAGTPEAEVEDSVQRTFIIAAQRLDDIRQGADKSFLVQTALHVAAHARRSAARRREVPAAEPPEVVDPADPELLTNQKRQRQLLDRVLDRLDPELRAVFVLYELEELTMAEIARTLELPPGTVASRLRRARVEFRERVREVEHAAKLRGQR
jgi:RNA polymerase sigma-70 factor (ECF subfamily)